MVEKEWGGGHSGQGNHIKKDTEVEMAGLWGGGNANNDTSLTGTEGTHWLTRLLLLFISFN